MKHYAKVTTNGGLTNVDKFEKNVSLRCSWVQRLFDHNFHDWKVIPLYLIENIYINLNYTLTLSVPIPDEETKSTYIFIFTLLYGASKDFMNALKAFTKPCEAP